MSTASATAAATAAVFPMTTSTAINKEPETAVPTLKVMRLQKPDLHMPTAGTLDNKCLLGSAMCLPDSFGVIHVGETFTAYLGALNVSKTLPVTRLTVSAQLQTPSQRWHLASPLDKGNAAGGVTVPPENGVDAIVAHALEEAGQHILRVEVGYGTSEGNTKTLRKFYRFQVSNPLTISELTFRTSDSCCFVSICLENNKPQDSAANNNATKPAVGGGGLTICSAQFDPLEGLIAEHVQVKGKKGKNNDSSSPSSSSSGEIIKAAELFDECGRLEDGAALRYMFKVTTLQTSKQQQHRGIAAGDELGKAVFTWRKACGEMGRMASSPIVCPPNTPALDPNDPAATMEGRSSRDNHHHHHSFVMTTQAQGGGSGLSVDVATAAAARIANPRFDYSTLDILLPVTVEAMNPPTFMKLGSPVQVDFLIVNHSPRHLTMQLQFRLEHMKGISVCGPSYKNMEEVTGNGGSTTVSVRFVALGAGLLQVRGCCIVDLVAGTEIPQPPLFNVMVQPELGQ